MLAHQTGITKCTLNIAESACRILEVVKIRTEQLHVLFKTLLIISVVLRPKITL